MRPHLERISYVGLLLLVLLSPLPLGSYRPWSWSLTAAAVGLVALIWFVSRLPRQAPINTRLSPAIPILFGLACIWVVLQTTARTSAGWHHPLWSMAADALQAPLPGRVSVSPDDGWTALMRLLSYALVFVLALEFGRDRYRAQAVLGWLTWVGLAYGVIGLAMYWGDFQPAWLFGEASAPRDVHSTFMNRNHFATWQGLTVICAIAWFYHRMAKPNLKPYDLPRDREARIEEFVVRAWKPMTALLLMVAALILTHSRGGFLASLAAVGTLVWLLDRRARGGRNGARLLVVTALVVTGIAFWLTSEVLLDRIDRTDITTEERLAAYANINRAIGDNPLLGFGYGTFADSYRLYDQDESPVHYYHAHSTWLENTFELGLPAALCLFLALSGLVVTCFRGVFRRHRDWVFPAVGVAASVLVGVHATVDFSLQLPAVAMLYALIMGVACAQSHSSLHHRVRTGPR